MTRDGFTFLEVVLALAILSLMAAILLRCASGILRADRRAHWLDESRFVAGRVAAETWLGRSAVATVTNGHGRWSLRASSVEAFDGTNRLMWGAWTVVPLDSSLPSSLIYLRAAGTNQNQPAM